MRTTHSNAPLSLGPASAHAVTSVWIEAIDVGRWQPRTVFDDEALVELSRSIRQVGVLQPLVVRPIGGGRYALIAGERRLRASKLAGLQQVPVVVRATSDQASLEIALIENIQREDIGPLECARAYRALMTQFGLTQERVAERVGKARTSIANTLRLLKLPPSIQDGLECGRISEGHARALLALDREDHQLAVYALIISKGLSVRDVEAVASKGPRAGRARRSATDVELTAIEQGLSERLGAPVTVRKSGRGGKIVIEFFSEEDLGAISERIGLRL